MRARPEFFALAAMLATALLPSAASAQLKQRLNWCNSKNGTTLDLTIGGCTALIQSGKYTGKNLAIAFTNRAVAQFKKHDYDRAISDFTQAPGSCRDT